MDPSDNPLGATDPTGYFSFKDALKIVAAVVVGVVTAGAALYAYGAVVGGSFIGGFVEGFGRDGFGRDRRIMLGAEKRDLGHKEASWRRARRSAVG
jgi:hypothetical protein